MYVIVHEQVFLDIEYNKRSRVQSSNTEYFDSHWICILNWLLTRQHLVFLHIILFSHCYKPIWTIHNEKLSSPADFYFSSFNQKIEVTRNDLWCDDRSYWGAYRSSSSSGSGAAAAARISFSYRRWAARSTRTSGGRSAISSSILSCA